MSGIRCGERYLGTGAPCLLDAAHPGAHDNAFERWLEGEPPPQPPPFVCAYGHGALSEADLDAHVWLHRRDAEGPDD